MAAIADWLAFRRNAALAATAPALVLFVWASTLGTSDHCHATVAAFAAATAAFLLVQNLAVLDRGRSWLVSRTPAQPSLARAGGAPGGHGVGRRRCGHRACVPARAATPIARVRRTGRRSLGRDRATSTGIAPFVDVEREARRRRRHRAVHRGGRPARLLARRRPRRVHQRQRGSVDAQRRRWRQRSSVGLPASSVPAPRCTRSSASGRWASGGSPPRTEPVATDLDDTLVVKSSSTLVAAADSVERPALLGRLASSPLRRLASRRDAGTHRGDGAPPADAIRRAARRHAGGDRRRPREQVVERRGRHHPVRDRPWRSATYFRSGLFQYDTTVDPVDTPDAIAEFLSDRRGFCVQFASAYAVMARSLGIPSRVAVGFTPGVPARAERQLPRHAVARRARVARDLARRARLDAPVRPDAARAATGGPGGSDLPERTPPPPVRFPAAPRPRSRTSPPHPRPVPRSTALRRPPRRPRNRASSITTSDGIAAVARRDHRARHRRRVPGHLRAARARRQARVAAPVAATPDLPPRCVARGKKHSTSSAKRTCRPIPRSRRSSSPASSPVAAQPAATRPLRDLARRYTSARYGNREPTADDAARAWESFDALADALEADLPWRERWRRRLDPATLPVTSRASLTRSWSTNALAFGVERRAPRLDLVRERSTARTARAGRAAARRASGRRRGTPSTVSPSLTRRRPAMSSPVLQQCGDGAADARHRNARVEQRRDHAQRDQVTEGVRPAGSVSSGTTSPMRRQASSCAARAPREPGGLGGGVAHPAADAVRKTGRRDPSGRASGCRRCRACS